MRRILFRVFPFMVLFLLKAGQSWGAPAGIMEIEYPPPGLVACDSVVVSGIFTLTSNDHCYLDPETWYIDCGYIEIKIDGQTKGRGTIGGNVGYVMPLSVVVSHDATVTMTAHGIEVYYGGDCTNYYEGCVRDSGVMDEKSVDVKINPADPCCGVKGECCPTGGGQ